MAKTGIKWHHSHSHLFFSSSLALWVSWSTFLSWCTSSSLLASSSPSLSRSLLLESLSPPTIGAGEKEDGERRWRRRMRVNHQRRWRRRMKVMMRTGASPSPRTGDRGGESRRLDCTL